MKTRAMYDWAIQKCFVSTAQLIASYVNVCAMRLKLS